MLDEDTIYEDGMIWLPKKHFDEAGLRAALTFEYGTSTYNTLKTFVLYSDRKTHIGVPRHFLTRESLLRFVNERGLNYKDLRPSLDGGFDKLDVSSTVVLDSINPALTVQTDAVKAMIPDDGILSLACGIGKTPVSLHLWATYLKTPLVVMADNTSILEQWERMIRLFIRPTDIQIGHVYDSRKDWDAPIVLASVQSVHRMAKSLPLDVRTRFGTVIIDEIHKVAAPVYSRVAPIFMGRRIGLTATPVRTDRLESVYQYHFGPVRFKYLGQPLAPKFYFLNPLTSRDLMEKPSFRRSIVSWGELNLQKVWSALARHTPRTQEIAAHIKRLMEEGRRVLVISQRKELLRQLNSIIPQAGLITGETPLSVRTKYLSEAPVVLGIMGIAKEGLDSLTLDTLVICEPFKDENLFQQVVGRILREHPSKQAPKVFIVLDSLGNGAGPVYGLGRRLKRIINTWPKEKGGPYEIEEWEG